MRRAIEEIQDFGIEVDIWKIEGVDERSDARDARPADAQGRGARGRRLRAARPRRAATRRSTTGCAQAAPVEGFVGFAIGRSIWWDALKGFLDGALDREAAAEQIADNYLRFIRVYEEQASASRSRRAVATRAARLRTECDGAPDGPPRRLRWPRVPRRGPRRRRPRRPRGGVDGARRRRGAGARAARARRPRHRRRHDPRARSPAGSSGCATSGSTRPRRSGRDTPVQCFARRAAAENARLVAGRRVRLVLDVEPRDRYGRLLAYVYRAGDGLFVNASSCAAASPARSRSRRTCGTRRGSPRSRGRRGARAAGYGARAPRRSSLLRPWRCACDRA